VRLSVRRTSPTRANVKHRARDVNYKSEDNRP
jgi:hypothetical protein